VPATEPLPTTSSTPNFTWTGLVRAAWNLFLVMFLVVTLAGFLGNVSRHAELTSHFRAQYTVVALLLIAICLVARQWRLAWLPIAALAVGRGNVRTPPAGRIQQASFAKPPAGKADDSFATGRVGRGHAGA
jgi:hypothetical protein